MRIKSEKLLLQRFIQKEKPERSPYSITMRVQMTIFVSAEENNELHIAY